jgi:hypothetical protein
VDRQTTIWLCYGMHVGLLGIGNSYVMSGFDLGWMELFWTCSSVPIRLKRQRNGLDTTSETTRGHGISLNTQLWNHQFGVLSFRRGRRGIIIFSVVLCHLSLVEHYERTAPILPLWGVPSTIWELKKKFEGNRKKKNQILSSVLVRLSVNKCMTSVWPRHSAHTWVEVRVSKLGHSANK